MKMANVTTRANSIHGIAIRKATNGWGNHSLIMFEHDDGYREYFESHWKKDKQTGVTGVRRCEWSNLTEWESEKETRAYRIQWLPYDQPAIQHAYRFCLDAVGKLRYAPVQLVHNLFHWYPLSGSSHKVTCCEFGALAIAVADHRGVFKHILHSGYRTFDQTAPSGAKFGLLEAVERIQNEADAARELTRTN